MSINNLFLDGISKASAGKSFPSFLHGLHGPHCPLSEKRLLILITHFLLAMKLTHFLLAMRDQLCLFGLVDGLRFDDSFMKKRDYFQTSNIRHFNRKKIVDNSDVVGASPVDAAPTTSSFVT